MDWLGAFLNGGPNLIGELATGAIDPSKTDAGKIAGAAAGVNITAIEPLVSRVAIIFLGFIFVAAGLIMFKPGTLVTANKVMAVAA